MARLPIPFDNPATYPGHSGVDYGQPRGTPFYMSGPGVVTWRGRNVRGGFFIWVQYDDGPLVGYHHMDSHRGCPPERSRGTEATRLGYVGNTGNSTGPHLHSEVAGHRTTAGYWQFFDPSRVIGSGSGASSSTSQPAVKPQEDEMLYLYVDDDGAGKPCWVLLNTRTGKHIWIYEQEKANGWATAWGNARPVTRQEFLNAIDAIEKTS